MSTNAYRKCVKCGVTAAQDNSVQFHRLVKPGLTNVLRATAWATYCWPNQDWSSLKSLMDLYKKSKVLCGRHFQDTCYIDSSKKQLSRHSIPGSKEYVIELMKSLRSKVSVIQKNVSGSKGQENNHSETSNCEEHHKLDNNDFSDNNADNADNILEENSVPDTSSHSGLFSWNKEYEVVPQEELTKLKDSPEVYDDTEDVLLYEEVQQGFEHKNRVLSKEYASPLNTEIEKEHEGFRCNLCKKVIIGFRYSCVQCPDYDLCAECETRGGHATHYMLRVPAPRPHEEVQSLLEAIRRHLLKNNVFLKTNDAHENLLDMKDSVNLEVREESHETTDPLASVSLHSDCTGDKIKEENIQESDEEYDTHDEAGTQEHRSKDLFMDSATYIEEEYLEESDGEYELVLQVQDAVQNEEDENLDRVPVTASSLVDILSNDSPEQVSQLRRKRKLQTPTEESVNHIVNSRGTRRNILRKRKR